MQLYLLEVYEPLLWWRDGQVGVAVSVKFFEAPGYG